MCHPSPHRPKQSLGSFHNQALQTPNANEADRTKPGFRRRSLQEPCSLFSHSHTRRRTWPRTGRSGPHSAHCFHHQRCLIHLSFSAILSLLLVGSVTSEIEISPLGIQICSPCWQFRKLPLNLLYLKPNSFFVAPQRSFIPQHPLL